MNWQLNFECDFEPHLLFQPAIKTPNFGSGLLLSADIFADTFTDISYSDF